MQGDIQGIYLHSSHTGYIYVVCIWHLQGMHTYCNETRGRIPLEQQQSKNRTHTTLEYICDLITRC